MFETGSGWEKSRSLGQIVENHIVHIRSKISFTPKVIALRSQFQSFKILHQSYMFKLFLRAYNCQMMDVVHIWHDRWRSKIIWSSTLPTPMIDFALHPSFQLIQASYAI